MPGVSLEHTEVKNSPYQAFTHVEIKMEETPEPNRKPILNLNMNSGEGSGDEGATQERKSAYETQSLHHVHNGRNILMGQLYPDSMTSAQ